MMLPPTYRDLWKKDFQDLKTEDVKEGRSWMYEADPFVAKLEREEIQARMAKKRDEIEKQKAKESDSLVRLGPVQGSSTESNNRSLMRGWTKVPKLDLSKRARAQIEELVRRNTVWNPGKISISDSKRRNIINELVNLGFRKSHVEEAVDECRDREETLEWLLIHVPEDDLPRWSLPEGYTAGISMATGNLKKEAILHRLASAGYSVELCEEVLDVNNGDEGDAAEDLQNRLVNMNVMVRKIPDAIPQASKESPVWTEEQDTLEAIYGDRFTKVSSNVYNIGLQVRSKWQYALHVRKSKCYPHAAPIISIISPNLPAYIQLSMIRQAIAKANKEFLGEPMIFNLIDWLESEIPGITENPGRLRDVSAGAVGLQENQRVPTKLPLHTRRKPEYQANLSSRDIQNDALFDKWQLRQQNSRQRMMLKGRQSLPAWDLRDDIIETVNEHQVTIISGETGSGKSTQSVQFILDDMIQRRMGATVNIICTQPRRISALGLADRVSDERCSPVGDEVGYAIRGESAQKPGITKITFVTTGVLLRRLQTSGGSPEDVVAALADVSHVVVDEVHERSLDTDFLLILLRTVLKRRKDFKVILMSATLDASIFDDYFNQTSTVGRIEIQGRTFPVDDYYLDDVIRMTGFESGPRHNKAKDSEVEDDSKDSEEPSIARTIQGIGMGINYELIASTVRSIDAQLGSAKGGILIFLPGTMEINRTLESLRAIPNIYPLPLHASLTSTEQRHVFPPAPNGKRKVVAATNIAETSITIEDIVAVIDIGKVKETSFDPQNNMVKLEEVWASRAACKQRRGRAGRVRAGKCYKLYTRTAELKMAERPEPEIRRVPLEQLCLSVRAMGIRDVPVFLASALTPPENTAVEGALDLLVRMGALNEHDLTALGRHLSMIPADLRCAKLLVYGATFGCLEACLTIASILTAKSPFVSPQAKREECKAARSAFAPDQGDLLCDLKAYESWSAIKNSSSHRSTRIWCDENHLSTQTLTDISSNRSQYLSSLTEAGFLPTTYHPTTHPTLNAHNSNAALIRALIAGAFNPQIARIDFPDKKFAPSMSGAVELDPEARTIKFSTQDTGRVFVHPGSTLFGAHAFPGNAVYMSYFTKLSTTKIFIRELTRTSLSPLSPSPSFPIPPPYPSLTSPPPKNPAFNAFTLLLFSGPITLDTLGRGLIVDGWLRLRGWARIGVLVSRLRAMLDAVLAVKIEDPGWDLGGDEVVGVVRGLVEGGL